MPIQTSILILALATILGPYCSVFANTLSQSPIAQENQLRGSTDWHITNPAIEGEISGYADRTSINRGEELSVFVSSASKKYSWDVFRLGWYQGTGARRISDPKIETTGFLQSIPTPRPVDGLVECDWQESFKIKTTSTESAWISGVYLIRLTEFASHTQSYIVFTVRDDQRKTDLVIQQSVTTEQAYNSWGGKSLYADFTSDGVAAHKVSFNRPQSKVFSGDVSSLGVGKFMTYYEYNFLRWVERQGLDAKYLTNIDVHEDIQRILLSKAFVSVGHDEYWSRDARDHLIQARDRGLHLVFFSSNTAYWQVRFEPDSHGRPNRRMVCYKGADADPIDHTKLKTVRWRDAPVSEPEDALLGVMYDTDYPVNADIVIRDASHWLFTGTGLKNGDHLPYLLGFEADRMFYSSPANTERLATSPYIGASGGNKYSDMTMYLADSGAIVFASGSMQWIWGLDVFAFASNPQVRPQSLNPVVETITLNLFKELQAAPMTKVEPQSNTILSLAFQDNPGANKFNDQSDYHRSVVCVDATCPRLVVDKDRGSVVSFTTSKEILDAGIESSVRGTGAFSVSFWLKTSTRDEGQVLIQQRDDHHASGFFGYDGSYHIATLPDGRLEWWTFDPKYEYALQQTSLKKINDGKWHFIEFSRGADHSGTILIDGIVDVSQQFEHASNLMPHTVFIGHDSIGPYPGFKGELDDLRIERATDNK